MPSGRTFSMTDQELRDVVATLSLKHVELTESQQETARQIRELGKQIGGLGDKFGSFTEGLALPSMTKILTNRFGMDTIAPALLSRKNGKSLELDVFAWSRARDEAYIVEVKSHLRDEALEQMRKTLREFHDYFPGYEGKRIHGILAAVHIPERMREKVLKEGFYLARIHDGQFELEIPDGFQPRAF
jgi:hypothetical protein